MRVLRVSHSATAADWRGRERALRARGADVEVYAARAWHAGGARVTLAEGEEAGAHPVATLGHHPALFVYDPRPLWRALGETWDVIDIHEEPFALATAQLLLLRALRRNRAPVVLYTAQNLSKRYPIPFRWLERWALRSADGISACNEAAARIVEAKGFAGRAQVIPLGVDTRTFIPGADAEHADDTGTATVGFVGRLVPEKGAGLLLAALSSQPTLRARIVGGGPEAADLADTVRRNGLSDRVELVGALPPADMPEFLGTLDVLAVPSMATSRWTEQFGRVVVEAMSAGVPVVTSDAGALPEVVGDAGLIVPAGDSDALGEALVEAATGRAADLRARGLARAQRYTWDAVAVDYLELYRTVRHAQPAQTPPVEVVVVAYGRPDLLRDALTPINHLPVTVVDNSSLTEIADLCAGLGVRYLDPGRNGGFAAGVNAVLSGDRLVPGADVLLVNPDARIEPEHIERLQLALRSDTTTATVGPRQHDERGKAGRALWPFPTPAGAWLDAVGLGRLRRGPQFVIGSVLLLRAEALAQIGAFDERFFLYAEETDWAFRAHLLGWQHREIADAHAVHAGGATSSDPVRREIHFHASQERYYRKHFGAVGWYVARAATLAGSAARGVALRGTRGRDARRRAALYRRGPVRVEAELTAGGER